MKYSLTRKTVYTYLEYAKKYKALLSLLLLITLVAATLEVITPIYYKQFFDTIYGSTERDDSIYASLLHIFAIFAGLQFTTWALHSSKGFLYNTIFLPKFLRDLYNRSFSYVQKHAYSFFIKNLTGSLTRKVGRFVDSAERIFDTLLWNFIPLVPEIIGIAIVTSQVNKWLSVLIVGWVVVYITIIYFYNRWKSKYDEERSKVNSKVSGRLADTFTNNTSIKLNANFNHEITEFEELTKKQARIERFSSFLYELLDTIQGFLMTALEISLLFVVLYFWRKGTVSIGDFVLVQSYAILLMSRLWNFGRMVRQLFEGISYSKEMVEILVTPHEVRDMIGAKELTVPHGKIEFQDVTFNYQETRSVLRKFNLTINPGEKVGVVGTSGAGKSTLVSLLLRYYDVTDGRILIDGQAINSVTQDSLRRNIAMIPQDVLLFHRTLMENIRYGRLEATDAEVFEAARLANAAAFIERVPEKYGALVGERGVRLSGGERQRIAIARAIVKNAPILVLDEATSSLDSESEGLIQQSLEKLMRNRTTIVIAHRLATLKKMDRIIVIDQGHIVEDGSHDTLLRKPDGIYKKLWKLQVGGFIEETSEETAEA